MEWNGQFFKACFLYLGIRSFIYSSQNRQDILKKTSTILKQELQELYKMGLGQAEQLCTLSVDNHSRLYSTVGFVDTFGEHLGLTDWYWVLFVKTLSITWASLMGITKIHNFWTLCSNVSSFPFLIFHTWALLTLSSVILAKWMHVWDSRGYGKPFSIQEITKASIQNWLSTHSLLIYICDAPLIN